jgi:hypothetical protein
MSVFVSRNIAGVFEPRLLYKRLLSRDCSLFSANADAAWSDGAAGGANLTNETVRLVESALSDFCDSGFCAQLLIAMMRYRYEKRGLIC